MSKFKYIFLVAYLVWQGTAVSSQEDVRKDANQFEVNVTKFGSGQSETGQPEKGLEGGLIKTEPKLQVHVIAQAKTFRSWIEKYHKDFALHCATMDKAEIVEVKGAWDNSSKPLAALGIPHTTISAGKLKKYDLANCKIMIIDCGGELSREACQIVRDFVSAGGALISTDWALKNTIEVAFPGYIQWNHFKTSPEIVDAQFVGKDPALFPGMVTESGWALDIDAEAIRIVRPQFVSVVAVSHALAQQEPDHLGILAVAFAFGRGHILHLIGHYGMSNIFMLMDPAPVIGISMRQALITNFIIAEFERKPKISN